MAEQAACLRELTGWTSQEIELLIKEKTYPDHWLNNPKPTYALIELIRAAIVASDISYRQGFPPIFDCLGLKQPPNLTGILSKVKRYISKANTTGSYLLLCQEATEVSKTRTEIIGPACSKIGITPEWLCRDDVCTETVTNQVIVELHQFCGRKDIPWKTVQNTWWAKLFPESSNIPAIGTIQSSWKTLADKKTKVSRHWSKDDKQNFLAAPYELPQPRVPKEPSDAEENMEEFPNVIFENDDSGYASSDGDTTVGYLLRSHGDTMSILHELLEEEKKEKELLFSQLQNESELRKAAEKESNNAQQASKQCAREKFLLSDQHKKECSKYKLELAKASALSIKLQKEVNSLTKSNVVRRLNTKTLQLDKEEAKTQKLKEEVEALKEEMVKLNEALLEKRRESKNSTEKVRYHKLKRGKESSVSEEENKALRNQLKELERENDRLKADLDEIMGDKEITTFEGGQYKADIRVVCYELISRGVGSNHVSDIIKLVLQRVGGLDCGRLPKPTLIRMMALEQALLAKESVKNALENSTVPITLHLDGTTKKHTPYLTTLASTQDGTYGIGFSEIRTENAETLLSETIDAVRELIGVDIDDEGKLNEILLKLKNTMTDRCVVNKKFVQLLQEWRERTLPKVMSNWDNLSPETKANMTTVNDLYCGKHLVLNFQEYAGAALKEWEQVESDSGKLGREKHLPWSRKESATYLAIRTVCEAYGPDASPQAGSPKEFSDYLHSIGDKSRLKAYRGNRFNIPFENGAAVYYHHHHGHIKATHDSLPTNRQNNQLTRSVKYDLQDPIIIGGIRAMGIMNVHITLPIMRMVDNPKISVIQTSDYYTKLHTSVTAWMEDPQALLDDSAILFNDFIPLKDDIHNALYDTVDESIEFFTKQALSIALHNIHVCIMRQLTDHLPGGKFHKPDTNITHETQTCPKDNVAAERVFAGLDYLKRKSPNISALAMQGILLWTQNKTMAFLDSCSESEREAFIKKAARNRKIIQKQYKEKVETIKNQRRKEVDERKKAQEQKERKLLSVTVTNTNNVLRTCGAICKSAEDVDELIHRKGQEGDAAVREALLFQIKYYKSVNRGLVKGSLFFLTSDKQSLTIAELTSNLKEIVKQIDTPLAADSSRDETCELDKQQKREELRQKLLSKLNSRQSQKRKCPFPEDIVNKRVRHICLDPSDELVTYKGRVLRESTIRDKEELMEEGFRPYLDKGYKFYTLIYDPPYDQLYCFPLKKEWDDGLLSIM